jgi:SAM-dependent methyltransferase
MLGEIKKILKIIKPLFYLCKTIRNLIRSVALNIIFINDYVSFRKYSKNSPRFLLKWKERFPCLNDKTENTSFDTHYIFHTAWAARKVRQYSPKHHVDISSSLYFNAIISAYVPVKFYDYRPAKLHLSNFETGSIDITSINLKDDSVMSLSCMHVIEHIGLGRYGDKLDPEGDLRAIGEIKRVLAKNGNLLFVVPIGKPVIKFNAHRIYSYDQIRKYFNDFELKEFSLIGSNSLEQGIIENATKEMADIETWGCGCFWFIK